MWEPPAQKQQPNVVWMERGAQHGNQAVYISVAGGRAGVCRYMSAGQESGLLKHSGLDLVSCC